MPLIINELGEFVEPDPPDRDERRAKVYASCVNARIRKPASADLGVDPSGFPIRECAECGERFAAVVPNKRFCCQECRDAYHARKKRRR